MVHREAATGRLGAPAQLNAAVSTLRLSNGTPPSRPAGGIARRYGAEKGGGGREADAPKEQLSGTGFPSHNVRCAERSRAKGAEKLGFLSPDHKGTRELR